MIFVNMKKTIGVVLMALFLLLNTQASQAGVEDSIGVEKKDGKRFVLHRLDAKETLYALSRRYGASVDDIKKANADVNLSELKVGQVLRVPSPEKSVNTTKPSSSTHIVITGETLYSIAKKYNVSVDEMKKLNPTAANGLSIGDELLIPGKAPVEQVIKRGDAPVSTTVTNPSTTSHTVAPGETLYSISRKYNVSVDDLKAWNPETSAGLKVGQVLKLTPIVVKLDTPPTTEKQKPPVIVVAEVKKDPVVETKKDPAQVTPPPDTVLTKEQEQEKRYLDSMANIRVQPNGEFKKVTETGFAEIIDGGDTDKYLALHKTAPTGTIIQVINEGNNQRIFVRVIGKLPTNGLNDRVVLKISKKAFERLAGVDKKIPVTLSYIM
ncbi:MAG: LysM peptidoglycan-binding domain-containing protein [Cytophagaceae bacterium]|nr:LysM peptidoglycan-binding domain-containing protein [Cytophagaceae bacterium]